MTKRASLTIRQSMIEPELTDFYRIWWDGIQLSKSAQKRMKIRVVGASEKENIVNYQLLDEYGVGIEDSEQVFRGVVNIEVILKNPIS